MSTDETPLGVAKSVKAILDHRTKVSRLGKSVFRETDQDIIAMREASRALAGLIALAELPGPQDQPSDARAVTLDDVYEGTTLATLVVEAQNRGEWCCALGCGTGACETCPCCSAGWCVSGRDGIPENSEDRESWLEVAAEYNPIAAALRAAGGVR